MKKNIVLFALLALVFSGNLIAQSRNRAEWPDTEYTKQVPKPPFDIKSLGDMSSMMGFIHVNFVEASVEGIEAYIENIKVNGFTIDTFNKTEARGETNIVFEAHNSDGWAVSIRYMKKDAVTLTIAKPKN
jgi:hypothetical protein